MLLEGTELIIFKDLICSTARLDEGLDYGAMSAHEALRISDGYTTMKQDLTLI